VTVLGFDHVQVAAPPGCEEEARAFYGGLLGMSELPKPEPLRARGGVWFQAGEQQLHVGVEEPFAPARKAHPGLVVSDLAAMRSRFRDEAVTYEDDDAIADTERLYVHDPFGNRLELRQA
jgi:catechol 2,3-dioxygenase-like lactoylglutathione lyase family enzyme